MSKVLITLNLRRAERHATLTMEITESGDALVDLQGLGLCEVDVGWGVGKWNSQFWDFSVGSMFRAAHILIRGKDRVLRTFLTRRDPEDEVLRHFERIRDTSAREWKLLDGVFPDAAQLHLPGTVAVGEQGLLFLEEDANGRQVRTWGKRPPIPGQPQVPPHCPTPSWHKELTIWTPKSTVQLTGGHDSFSCDLAGAPFRRYFYLHDSRDDQWRANFSGNGLHLTLPPGTPVRNVVLHRRPDEGKASLFFKRIHDAEKIMAREWVLESGTYPGPDELELHGDVSLRAEGLCMFVEKKEGREIRRWREVSHKERLPNFDA